MATIATTANRAASEPGPKRAAQIWLATRPFFANGKARLGLGLFLAFVLTAVLAPWLAPYSPSATLFPPEAGPTAQNLLGTTQSGQDVLSQLIWGTRASLEVALGAGLLTTVIAILVGILSGFIAGVVDAVLTVLTNVFLIIPSLVLVIVVSSYLQAQSELLIIVLIAVTSWPWGARVLRAQTLSLRAKDFVVAAQLGGEATWRIAFQEILPNMVSLAAASFFFTCLYAVVTAASLQFLGLGDISTVSWGTMLYWANNGEALLTGAWWWFIPPGLCLGLLGASFALMNFAVDEITNPRLRTAGGR
jgi:peptide/nickel transport system permease protein